MARILSGGSTQELGEAQAAFKNVVALFPNSPYRAEAELILALQAQIDRLRGDVKEREERIHQLAEELQKLKEIDLQRKPSRPPP